MTIEALLKAPFRPDEHEFDYDGYCYLTETALTERLDLVCGVLGWSLKPAHAPQKVTQTHWIVSAELSIFYDGVWVSRLGVGEGVTAIPKDFDFNNQRRALNLAEHTAKKAATDALKRAARLFGIGRYILSLPRSIKSVEAIETWMVNTGLINKLIGKKSWWSYLKADEEILFMYEHINHVVNTIKLLDVDLETISYEDIKQTLIDRQVEKNG